MPIYRDENGRWILMTTESDARDITNKYLKAYVERNLEVVIRCRDCEWFYGDDFCTLHDSPEVPHGYCNYGKKNGEVIK